MISGFPHTTQRGIALVYVLLIVFLITAIAITISIIIINELRLTRTASDATLAYYAAESGIERGLYTVKRLRTDGTQTLQSAVGVIQGLGDSLSNTTRYDNSESAAQSAIIQNQFIAQDRFIQADYYDFENPLNPVQITESLVISNAGNNPFSWAEVSWVAWDEHGTLGESAGARKIIGPTDLTIGWTIPDLDTFDAIDPRGYRIRIKALFGDLSSVTVTPYDQPNGAAGGGAIVDLPSLIEIKSIGEKSSLKQALTATIPWKIPLFGLYDYVLFSEGELLKSIILSDPTYSSGPIHIERALNEGVSCTNYASCQGLGWLATDAYSSMNDNASCDTISGGQGCFINPEGDIYGFGLPIPSSVVAGDTYYLSARMYYQCSGSCGAEDRDIAVEINGQSSIIPDQAASLDGVWRTCTLPETFTVGDTTLPIGHAARTVKFTNHPSGAGQWSVDDLVFIDWYQLSTFKLFQDCD